ncbi:MAG: hypothetical protein IJU99_10180, partial [Lachnospiraceae bacterium]|nr:hypothetical protein [Lachnospiraceae bacterium]
RGFDFAPLDINKADPKYFRQVDDKHIMPPLTSISGIGGKDADDLAAGLLAARKDGPFLSVEDFKTRAKVSQTIADTLAELGVLGDIPKTNQISLDDLFSL